MESKKFTTASIPVFVPLNGLWPGNIHRTLSSSTLLRLSSCRLPYSSKNLSMMSMFGWFIAHLVVLVVVNKESQCSTCCAIERLVSSTHPEKLAAQKPDP